MIKSIFQNSKYVTISGGSPSSPAIYNSGYNPNVNSAQIFTGQVRYNQNGQCLEIFDGNIWQTWASSAAGVGLTAEAERILDWANQKINEEYELEKLAESNPTIKDLLNQVKEKQDQIKMVKTLLKKEEWHDGMAQVATQAP